MFDMQNLVIFLRQIIFLFDPGNDSECETISEINETKIYESEDQENKTNFKSSKRSEKCKENFKNKIKERSF